MKCVDLEAKKDFFDFFHNNVPNVSRVHFRFIIVRCLFHFLYKTATRLDLSSLDNRWKEILASFSLYGIDKITWQIDVRCFLITMALIHSYFVDIFVHGKLLHSSASRTHVTIYDVKKCQQSTHESMPNSFWQKMRQCH